MHQSVALALVSCVAVTSGFGADDLETLFRESSHELTLEDGKLSGPGL